MADDEIKGSCHCGALRWKFRGMPADATLCNCTVCRRYGALWAYDYEGEGISVDGPSKAYLRQGGSISFHFCASCGAVAWWRGRETGTDGRRRMAVNLRLAETPDAVADVPLLLFDGYESFEDITPDGRRVRDVTF